MKQIDKLIINTPYEQPKYYWHYDREHRSFEKREGRRPAGYVVATPDSKGFDDPGVFVPIELVNKIRPAGCFITGRTRRNGKSGVFSSVNWKP
jgi:type III restriction enzyme